MTATVGAPQGTTFSSLRVPSYRAWFFSQIFSSSGLMTQSVGMSWLVLQLTGHAVDLALLGAATMLPVLVGGAYAGSLVDRVDRRGLLMLTQLLFIGFCLVLVVLSATGSARLWALLAIAFLTGMVNAIDGPARQVYVMDLVGPSALPVQ